MARSNTGSAANYLSVGSTPITVLPCSIVGWAYVPTAAGTWQFVEISNNAATHYVRLGFATTTDNLSIRLAAGGGSAVAVDHFVVADEWFHFAVVIPSAMSAILYYNGVAGVDTNLNRNPVGMERIAVGVGLVGGPTQAMIGRLAEVAIYGSALSGAQIAQMAAPSNYSPAIATPTAPVAYWKLLGTDSPEPDSIGVFPLTITGTLPQSTHPSPIYYETLSIAATHAAKAEGTP